MLRVLIYDLDDKKEQYLRILSRKTSFVPPGKPSKKMKITGKEGAAKVTETKPEPEPEPAEPVAAMPATLSRSQTMSSMFADADRNKVDKSCIIIPGTNP